MSKKDSFLINRLKSIGYAFKGAVLLLKTEASIKIQFTIALLLILPVITLRLLGKIQRMNIVKNSFKETIETIYNHAITKKYRFFSYGDSSLLFP